ncbi:hypothetical protein ACO1O0_008902 [Amphichorda felina]
MADSVSTGNIAIENGGALDQMETHLDALIKRKRSSEDDGGPELKKAHHDTPNKRKRSVGDDGGPEQKKAYLEGDDPNGHWLQRDLGAKYLVCQTPPTESLPRTTEDLYEMFNLTGLAAEVAREKPNGEKNALRKTYKGHMKRLGVAGHFDVVKKPEDAPSEFMAMLQVPDLEWDVHQVKGKELDSGLSETTLASLGRALTITPGPVPKAVWDSSVLDEQSLSSGIDGIKTKPATPGTPLPGTPGANSRTKPNFPPGHDPSRPKRSIKKRAYGDNSFEGYGEGFPDDEGGYSTGEGESGAKRRNKASSFGTLFTMRQQNYGPGMVGA